MKKPVWLALGLAFFAAGAAAAAPLKVAGRFLQDAHGNNLMLRGVNLPVYHSGYVDDLDDVAAAIALTKTNAVRLEWWANPQIGTTEYTVANFDRAIQKFYDLGIIPVVELHDLTFQYGHDDKVGANSDGNSRTIFANTITAFWTRADVVAILVKHQDHLVINIANEWGSSLYSDASSAATNFIQNYTDAIVAMRNAGIIAPLMIDAPKGFEYQFLLDHGQALLDADPQHNTMLSAHAYWAATAFTAPAVEGILDAFTTSGLPIVLGEASSNAYTDIPCDPINYAALLGRANTNAIGYLFWAWYEDGQCGQLMNITVGADGVTRPTAANPGFGYDALYHPNFGIDAALPLTQKADFSPVSSSPPSATTGAATSVSGTGATLNGTVNPNGTSTTAHFDYGLTTGYGAQTTASPAPGSGSSVVSASASIAGLSCSTTYHFRLVATSAAGTTNGADATLATPACQGLSVDDPSIAEGGSGRSILAFTLSLSQPSLNPVTVNYATANGTAAAGSDYVAASGTFTIPAGSASKRVTILVQSDAASEGNETLTLTLSNANGAPIAKSVGTGTILNDDPAAAATTVTQYRLYHDGTKEHLYTTDLNEYTALGTQGWIQEGLAYKMLTNGVYNGVATVPLFRAYHPGILQHHWTTDSNEAVSLSGTPSWFYEGTIGYLVPTQVTGTIPLYRMALANPALHLWTTDLNEYTVLQTRGWIGEGITGYVVP